MFCQMIFNSNYWPSGAIELKNLSEVLLGSVFTVMQVIDICYNNATYS